MWKFEDPRPSPNYPTHWHNPRYKQHENNGLARCDWLHWHILDDDKWFAWCFCRFDKEITKFTWVNVWLQVLHQLKIILSVFKSNKLIIIFIITYILIWFKILQIISKSLPFMLLLDFNANIWQVSTIY